MNGRFKVKGRVLCSSQVAKSLRESQNLAYYEAFLSNQNLVRWRGRNRERAIQSVEEGPIQEQNCKIVGKQSKSSRTKISYAGGDKIVNGPFKEQRRVLYKSQCAKQLGKKSKSSLFEAFESNRNLVRRRGQNREWAIQSEEKGPRQQLNCKIVGKLSKSSLF